MLDNLAAGPVGLLVGAVIGLAFTVLFEDQLKSLRASGLRRLRLRLVRPVVHEEGSGFAMGPIRSGLHIVEGDGEAVIPEDGIYVSVDPDDVELPPEVAEWRQEIAEREEAKRGRGEDAAWNGPSYAIERFVISRRPEEETPEIFIRLRSADFYTFLATQQLDRPLRDGGTLRGRYLDGRAPEDAPGFLASSFGANIAVVTCDGFLVVSKRSDRVSTFPGLWNSSANEALSRTVDSRGRNAPDFYELARRGMKEELALERSEYELAMLAFGICLRDHQWVGLYTARLTRLSSADLRERWSRGKPDAWEHAEHRLVPFNVRSVLRFLFDPDRHDAWTPMGPPLFYLALVHEFGRNPVDSELSRFLRQELPALVRRRSRAGVPAA